MSRAERTQRAALVLVLLVHAALVLRLVSFADLASGRVLGAIDYQNHYYEAVHARQRFHRDGSLLGYDPFWMSGYPEGLFGLIENRFFYLLMTLAPAGAEPVIFNVSVVALLLTIPLAIYAAARASGHSRGECAAATALASVATFTIPIVVKCWFLGMISFLVCSVWFVPAVVLLSRALVTGSLADRGAKLGIAFAALSTLLHAASAVVFAPGLAVALWHGRRRGVRALAPLLAAIAVVFALLNLPAVLALAGLHTELHGSFAQRFLQGGVRQLGDDFVFRLLRTSRFRENGLGGLAAIFVLAAVPVRAGARTPVRPVAAVLWASGSFFFFLTYLSSSWEAFSSIQPYRFLVPLAFLLCLPAGRGLVSVLAGVRGRRFGMIAAAAVTLTFVGEAGRSLIPHAALGTGVDRGEAAVTPLLRDLTYPHERILVESAGAVLPAFPGTERTIFSGRFSLLPLAIHRECIGDVLPGAILRESYAGFVFDQIVGRPLAGMADAALGALLRAYAVSWIVAWREPSVRELRSHTAMLEEVGEADGVVVFRVRDPSPTRVLEGKGEVTTLLDRIDVKAAAGKRIVLKYHWAPTLETEPPLAISEAAVSGSPVGFIAVEPGTVTEFAVVSRLGFSGRGVR